MRPSRGADMNSPVPLGTPGGHHRRPTGWRWLAASTPVRNARSQRISVVAKGVVRQDPNDVAQTAFVPPRRAHAAAIVR
jgi:hypothetical protein